MIQNGVYRRGEREPTARRTDNLYKIYLVLVSFSRSTHGTIEVMHHIVRVVR